MSPNKDIKMKTRQKKQKMVAQNMSIYGMIFRKRTFSCLHELHSNLLKSSDLIKPARRKEIFQRHLQLHQIPSSLRLAVEKVKFIVTGTVDDTEAVAAHAAEDIHSIGHVAPHGCVATAGCGRRSARGQLTPAIGLAKVAQML